MYDQGWVDATSSIGGDLDDLEERVEKIEIYLGWRQVLIQHIPTKGRWHIPVELPVDDDAVSTSAICGKYIPRMVEVITSTNLDTLRVCKKCLAKLAKEEEEG
jgi:hypothetical protein